MGMTFSEIERDILDRIQCDFPLSSAPYECISRDLGCTESRAHEIIVGLRAKGVIRRIGGSFSAERLGYSSALVAARVDQDAIESVAEKANAYTEVTHNYEREGSYNLWFTVIGEDSQRIHDIVDEVAQCRGVRSMHLLPALRVFKIRVDFGFNRNQLPSSVALEQNLSKEKYDPSSLSDTDRRIIRRACGDIGGSLHPFREMATEIDVSQDELIERLNAYKKSGMLRRFGAILLHKEAGYAANGMSVWNVPDQDVERVGELLAACRDVSHCYERSRMEDWPYNVYAMIHCRTKDGCTAVASRLSSESDIGDYGILFSVREFKKTSFTYFNDVI